MLNPNEIDPKHLPPIQAALMKHRSRLDEHRIAKLYRLTKQLFQSPSSVQDSTVALSRTVAEKQVAASCTDLETGLFIQLTGDPERGTAASLLTFGQKFCQELRDTQRQNLATRIW